MEVINEHAFLLLALAGAFGFFMAWGIGANDVANAMGTSVGAKALTIRQAIVIAVIFEFAGAFLAGGEVTSTIRKGIIDSAAIEGAPDLLVFGMLASLLAAGTWLLIASMAGWPVSTTHSIVGALVGFTVVALGVDAVQWGKVSSIVASWVVSPVLAGTMAFFLFLSVQKLVLNTENPFENAKKWVPMYMFMVGWIISMVTLTKGLKHVGLSFSYGQSVLIATLIGLIVVVIGKVLLSKIKLDPNLQAETGYRFANVERVFGILMIFTAAAMAFAHGSNDVANAIGPLAAIVSVIQSGGTVAAKSALPTWILVLGGSGIAIGLATYGYRVMATIGRKITELTPTRGFAAELAAASTVVLASATGLPISTTHTLVGAVLGVGLARGIAALNLRVVGSIFVSWLVTLPAGAGLTIVFFYALKAAFGLAA
ncbi:MAG: inorganic phosphate transporter [Pseudomonadales bacterium]